MFALSSKTKTAAPQLVQTKNTWGRALKRNFWLYVMLIPGVTLILLFCYKPMVGILMAFEDYKYKLGFFKSPWVGLDHFKRFFEYRHCWRLIRNTLLLNIYSLLWSMPVTLIFSFMVNELKNGIFRKCITTISYIPHFISTVIVVSVFWEFLTPSGFINNVLTMLGQEKVDFLQNPDLFRTIYIIIGIWTGTGWGSIIYISALSGIDQELYEAAYIDGAGKLKQTWYISLPGIASTISVMLIMSIGGMLGSATDKILLLYNSRTMETADVIGTYIYRVGLIDADYGYSTAVGLFQSLVGMILLTIANTFSKKVTESSLF